jgi:hypothetical protein
VQNMCSAARGTFNRGQCAEHVLGFAWHRGCPGDSEKLHVHICSICYIQNAAVLHVHACMHACVCVCVCVAMRIWISLCACISGSESMSAC